MPADLVVMLSVAVSGGLLAQLLRLPPLVGFLGAGFALSWWEIESNTALESVADAGVLLLLFAIGLKVDVRGLLRREVVGVAGAHVVASTALGFGVLAGLAVLGVGLVASAGWVDWVLLALALSFSSTVIAVKNLDQQHSTQSLFGRTAIGILIIQDLIAVVVIAATRGTAPSWWALALLALVPASMLVSRWLDLIAHGELLVLVSVVLALVPGYALFDAVGLKGDLGALVVGMLLAGSARADEMSKALFSLKELLLVGFFLTIGMNGVPGGGQLALALVLVLLVPVKGFLFAVLLRLAGFRVRSATHTAVALTSHSEFALILAAVGVSSGVLDAAWLTVLSTAVALSFVVTALMSRQEDRVTGWTSRLLRDPAHDDTHPDDRPIDVTRADAVVLGMGRIGQAAHHRLTRDFGLHVMGVESDPDRVRVLRDQGVDVVECDATDPAFWTRVTAEGTVSLVVLAMPFHGSNMAALHQLERSEFRGSVAAVTRYDEETDELVDRVDTVFGLYDAAGTELADQAALDAGLRRPR